VDVLRNMIKAVKPGGPILDLQVIRPNPVVETDSEGVLCEIDGEPLFELADAAAASVDAAIRDRLLTEEAVDDHDVRKHYADGADLIADYAEKKRRIVDIPLVQVVKETCVVRERCRLRRLRVEDT
jgi:cobalamin biosynthesis protein CbiG